MVSRETEADGRFRALAVGLPTALMLALGLWGIDRGGIWRDEAVTFQVARRSVPEIWRLLHGVDAVHGLYYLLMHTVLALRPGEVVLRLPSVGGAAAAAGLVAALGMRLAGPRVGLWAGLLYAVTPLAGHYAQEGRSYALVGAGVAGATLLLVRAMDGGRTWLAYTGVVGLTCLLHELAVLMLCAHAVTLAASRAGRRVWARWAGAVVGTGLMLLPLVLASRAQAGQVEWLPEPGLGSVERLLRGFVIAPKGLVFETGVVLMLAGLAARGVAAVALPLMTVPPGLLMLVSQVRPMYDDRYVLYSLAGAPLLIAAGADRLADWIVGRMPYVPLAGALAVLVAFLHHLPLHRQDRAPDRRPDNLAAVSALAAGQIRRGDPVLFVPSIGRRAAVAYPEGFRQARDIALREPGPDSGTLYGRETGAGELRRRLAEVDRVWVVAEPYTLRSDWRPRNPVERAKITVVWEDFVPRAQYVRGGVTLRLYERRPTTVLPLTGPPRRGRW
ncbi:glycosyltransferase family 39 protein [Streptomyces sp. P17]|uniref:glycosyltransferase family 39 protein n=1 Tax=Streptomyces sp. P17 TaxID=3074716 RepID=UPI0028F4397C|nr:glycosyltransferase family 39 protein [Streptomyces sp. P17]MDT9700602.1 glycosyltransferase family 39 protein [Streptomyces sp. P17]